jgi:hypothetical protein
VGRHAQRLAGEVGDVAVGAIGAAPGVEVHALGVFGEAAVGDVGLPAQQGVQRLGEGWRHAGRRVQRRVEA